MNFNFGLPQLIYIGLTCVSCGLVAAQHGKPKDENYNFWVWAISQGITYSLLIWGGFFK